MKKYLSKKKKIGGYAMLFTVIIVSAISVITAGVVNATYKQLILSSLAKDSQIAFYQADTATECALYMDRANTDFLDAQGGSWVCGGFDLIVDSPDGANQNYSINPKEEDEGSTQPCFRIVVEKNPIGVKMDTKIIAKGYNVCNITNPRTVERAIEVNYSE